MVTVLKRFVFCDIGQTSKTDLEITNMPQTKTILKRVDSEGRPWTINTQHSIERRMYDEILSHREPGKLNTTLETKNVRSLQSKSNEKTPT